MEKDVTFVEETEPRINDQFDAALRMKYRRYDARYVDPMLMPEARAATIKLVLHSTHTQATAALSARATLPAISIIAAPVEASRV